MLIFKILLGILLITAVDCSDDSENNWPDPTCGNFYGNCLIYNVKQTKKTDMIFKISQISRRNAESYSSVLILGNNTVFNYLPKNFCTIFSRLEILTIQNKRLLKIERGDFANAKNLGTITATENLLPELEDYTFEGADNIHRLVLYNNKIRNVGAMAFSNLRDLRSLFLDGNLFDSLDVDLFKNNTNLNHLSLAVNNLSNIDFIHTLINLRVLSVDRNRISHINANLFRGMTELREFYISGNCLTEFNFEEFPAKSLRVFTVSNNYLRYISVSELKINYQFTGFQFDNNNINCEHVQDIIDGVGKYKIGVQNRSIIIPNVMGIRCKINDSYENIHELEDKCVGVSGVYVASGRQHKKINKIKNGLGSRD